MFLKIVMNREMLAILFFKKEKERTSVQNERWGGNIHLKKKKLKICKTTFQTSMQKLKS